MPQSTQSSALKGYFEGDDVDNLTSFSPQLSPSGKKYYDIGKSLISDKQRKDAQTNQKMSNTVYNQFMTDRNQFTWESKTMGLSPAMFNQKASFWMHLFSWILLALLFLEMVQCLGRPNYGNAVVAFGIYLAILLDLREDSQNHSLAQSTLRTALFAAIALTLFDIWYLVFGTMVGVT